MDLRSLPSNPEASAPDPNPLRTIVPEILADLNHLDLSERAAFKESKVVSGGAYGDVSIAERDLEERERVKVAVKRLCFYLKEDIKPLFEKEIHVWSKLKHSNVLPLLGYTFDEVTGYPLLVSEWMEKGSAWAFIKSNPECDLLHLVTGIARGLAYLHEKDVVHSDIKSDNIVVSESGEALICDFGCSRMIDASRTLANLSTGIRGTPQYLAYELLAFTEKYTKHTKETDVWAFGMTVYELTTRQRPYDTLSPLQVVSAIMRSELPTFPSASTSLCNRNIRDMLWTICNECWVLEPTKRAQMTVLLDILQSSPDLGKETALARASSSSTTPINDEIPDLSTSGSTFLSSSDYDALSPYLKECGRDWSAIFNPAVKRTLSLSLAHDLRHDSMVRCVRFSADGKLLATGCNRTVQIYNTGSGLTDSLRVRNFHVETASQFGDLYIRSLCFSPNDSLLATGADDGVIRTWRFDKIPSPPPRRLVGHNRAIYCLCFSENGLYLVSGSGDSTARVWVMQPVGHEALKTTLQCDRQGAVTSVAISPNCLSVITWLTDYKAIQIWNLHTGSLINELQSSMSPMKSIDFIYLFSFTPGKCIAIGRSGRKLAQWNITCLLPGSSRNHVSKLEFESHEDTVLGCAIGGQWIASGLTEGYVLFGKQDTGEVQFLLHGHEDSVVSVDFNPFNGLLATGSSDKTVRIWRYSTIHSGKRKRSQIADETAPAEGQPAPKAPIYDNIW